MIGTDAADAVLGGPPAVGASQDESADRRDQQDDRDRDRVDRRKVVEIPDARPFPRVADRLRKAGLERRRGLSGLYARNPFRDCDEQYEQQPDRDELTG